MKNEVSYRFESAGNATDERRDSVMEDAQTRRGNMSRLVRGQAGLFPKRRIKDWGVPEIERGTNMEESDRGVSRRI